MVINAKCVHSNGDRDNGNGNNNNNRNNTVPLRAGRGPLRRARSCIVARKMFRGPPSRLAERAPVPDGGEKDRFPRVRRTRVRPDRARANRICAVVT